MLWIEYDLSMGYGRTSFIWVKRYFTLTKMSKDGLSL